jgi:hypothetical protein
MSFGGDNFPWTSAVNNADTLAGWLELSNGGGQVEGFMRGASGPFTFFGVPGAAITYPKSINTSGTIIGYSETEPGVQTFGFIRSPSGELTTFQVDGLGTSPVSINSSGVVTGYYSAGSTFVGFIRNVAGEIVKFQPSGAVDTMPASINDSGTIVGSFDDTAGTYHGFVWIP